MSVRSCGRTALMAVMILIAAQRLSAQERTFSWYAELMSVDPPGSATVRVQLLDPVLRYIGRYNTGDLLTLVWSAEGDAIVYAPLADEMKAIAYGQLVAARLVSFDAAGKTATVSVTLGAGTLAALRDARPGQWIKVTAPAPRPLSGGAMTVQLAERPQRTAPVRTAAASTDLTGNWTIS